MAKFTGGDLRLKDNQRTTFGTDLDCSMFWDGTADQLRLTCTLSGVDPTQDYHLTTKWYVDDAIATATGTLVSDHGELTGLGDDDHTQYILVDGTRAFTGTVSGVTPTEDAHLTTKQYVDSELDTLSGSIHHGGLVGLSDDDHTQYILVDGTRGFTGVVAGVTPTQPNHLTTKEYVDNVAAGLDWQDSVLSQTTPFGSAVASEGNRYIAPTTSGDWTAEYIYEYIGTTWSGIEPNEGFATWVEDEDIVYIYDGTYPAGTWVKFMSAHSHNSLNGLQGGTTDEYYHLTSAQYTALTDDGGVADASSQHTHDDRYYTESEVDTISGTLQTEIDNINNNFDENAQDAVGNIMVGAGSVTVTYDDGTPQITVSGTTAGEIDHGSLAGLGDDDHTQYVLTNGSRGFTSTVSGVDPTQGYELATKNYVDGFTVSGTVDNHGRAAVANGASQVTINFPDLGHTNYTVNATLENTTDSPPSIYAFIVSAKNNSNFTITFMGDMDSANYILNWSIVDDS